MDDISYNKIIKKKIIPQDYREQIENICGK